ncbi:hypothetical protein ACFX13_047682 [Malus domestica]
MGTHPLSPSPFLLPPIFPKPGSHPHPRLPLPSSPNPDPTIPPPTSTSCSPLTSSPTSGSASPSLTFPYSSSFFCTDDFFLITAPFITFSPILKRHWLSTSPLRFSRINPLVGVDSPPSLDSSSSVASDSWLLYLPLPADICSRN